MSKKVADAHDSKNHGRYKKQKAEYYQKNKEYILRKTKDNALKRKYGINTSKSLQCIGNKTTNVQFVRMNLMILALHMWTITIKQEL